ncbi:MAG: type II toxin-antitoxin system HicB family antitoxin [Thiomargarita sp.]|nr:type II toxin-antitoxin system HicB family antitoxin [Thiomargarita sp.]
MLYPIYVHQGDEEHAHGVTIPDFPGCFSAADNWDELPTMVQEAIELYCDGEELELPKPSSLDKLTKDNKYQGGVWIMLDINIFKLNLKPVPINISLPSQLISHIDTYTHHHQMTRNDFLTRAAQEMLSK